MANEADRCGDSTYWLHSDDYKSAAKDRRRTIVVGYIGLLAGLLTWAIPFLHKEASGLMVAGPAWFAVAASVAYFRYYTAQRRFQEKQEFTSRDDGSTVPGFPDELKRSRNQMVRNGLIYGNQARNADRNSQAAMILGLIFITGFAAVTSFLVKAPSSRAVFAGVAVVGAAYSAYISKTFIAVRESALKRYDRVSSRMELEDAFLHAERIVHDMSAMTRSERLILMREIFEARLAAIQKTLEEPDQTGDRFGAPARRRKPPGVSRRSPGDRHPVSRPSVNMSPVRPELQETVQAFLLELSSRLALDKGAGKVSDDEADEEGPSDD